MSGEFIFEHPHRGQLVRLQLTTYRGHPYANIRRWYLAEGDWKPGKEGCSLPLDCLPALTAALMEYHGIQPPEAQSSGS
jgi:hypothetical protein